MVFKCFYIFKCFLQMLLMKMSLKTEAELPRSPGHGSPQKGSLKPLKFGGFTGHCLEKTDLVQHLLFLN